MFFTLQVTPGENTRTQKSGERERCCCRPQDNKDRLSSSPSLHSAYFKMTRETSYRGLRVPLAVEHLLSCQRDKTPIPFPSDNSEPHKDCSIATNPSFCCWPSLTDTRFLAARPLLCLCIPDQSARNWPGWSEL